MIPWWGWALIAFAGFWTLVAVIVFIAVLIFGWSILHFDR